MIVGLSNAHVCLTMALCDTGEISEPIGKDKVYYCVLSYVFFQENIKTPKGCLYFDNLITTDWCYRVLGTWLDEHPYCTNSDILFLFLLTNLLDFFICQISKH